MATRRIYTQARSLLSVGLLSVLAFANAASASEIVTENDINAPVAAIGGLTVFPAMYRYRPMPRLITHTVSGEGNYRPFVSKRNRRLTNLLDNTYLSNRTSLVNTIRTRRGLSLLTFYESRDRCLFFGINERGFAGINFMPVRSLTRKKVSAKVPAIERHYELLLPDHVIHDSDGSLLLKTIY